MKVVLYVSLFFLGYMAAFAQAPAPAAGQLKMFPPSVLVAAQPAQIENSDIGFNYSLPTDWEFVTPPQTPKATVPFPDAVTAKKGNACVEVVFTAKHGTPVSVVVVAALPFACYGQTMTPGDLQNFGAGAAEGLKQTFEVTEPVEGNYTLGRHAVWIERAKGTPKGHPNDAFTFETACTILAKGAVCWMTMAADAASLQAFERAPVALDGESYAELVPANAFIPNP
ncbi:MAG: hypothetical protein ABSD59_24445 [Terracidiphilus sp.]|jgi:hypothetical protein